ncbi:MAG TPA: aminotransferase class I/II-fold pyridoxal phosphate-dependent enzyme, partial [Blastocatellia bacterium]|nr:aminotransferase class I/II-fold pyridoxal phosphate-dependent enzyme [Blastocatellia bacterium]
MTRQETEAGTTPEDDHPVPGDMSAEEFRRYGHQVIDWIADYLSHPDRYSVMSQAEPGDIKRLLPAAPPEKGEDMQSILHDFDRVIIPGMTHWNHPCFFAYIANSSSGPGMLADMFSSALNVNAMLWRTSPAATELEEVALDWLRQMLGLPSDFSGVIYDTASISTLCAIAAAREAVSEVRVREVGLAGAPGQLPPRLRLYTSEHAHSSIEKGAITLGLGKSSVRLIPADSEFRMDAAKLAEAIEEDRTGGLRPFCVVATVGTTSTGAIDPVPEIADICEREKLWLHVDAAYGGPAGMIPEKRHILNGVERADSIVINPHKWLFVPVDLSALYSSRIDVLKDAFSLVPEYLRTAEASRVNNYMDYGPQLGRRFRAIKLWFVLRYFGVEGIRSRIGHHLELARELAGWIDESPDFERLAPLDLAIVCFRARPSSLSGEAEEYLDGLNQRLLDEVNRRGKLFFSHTKLNGQLTLRLVIGNIHTTRDHVKLAWDELNAVL